MKPCRIPAAVLEDDDAFEVMRVFPGRGGPHVSLDMGWQRTGPAGGLEPEESWGYLLANIAGHIANALHQRTGYPREFISGQINAHFIREAEAEAEASMRNAESNRKED